jgi:DNA polymerase-3 subunit delta
MIFSNIVAMLRFPLGGGKNTRPASAASTRRVAVASGAASPHNRLPLKLTPDTLRTHLAGEPARAYLVSGDEVLLVSEAADAIRARIKRAGFEERDVHFIERVADWDAVRASANNLSLFGSRKLIELRLPSGKPGVGGANAIVELLANAGPDNVFLMITGKLEREQNNSAWVKAFESAGAWLPVWPVEVTRLPHWLRARAAALKVDLDDDAVQFIVERTEGNLLAAQQELQKLELYAPGKKIDLGAVQASIGNSARYDVFQLGEAALGGDVPRAVRILAGLHSEGVEPVLALWSLAREIRNAWGTTQNEGLNARSWQRPSAALEAARGRAPRLPFARLAARVSRADRMIKGQQYGDAWDEMALMIVEFSGRRALPLAGTRAA